MIRRLSMLCACLMLWGAASLSALEAPEGSAVLTVGGEISTTNVDGVAVFDRDMLAALDWREIETYTSFTDGPQRFAGPTLRSLLDAVGAKGDTLIATAINDYAIEIPVEHAALYNVLLAMEHNGDRMRIRDKGPIWVVYPLTEEEAEDKPFDGEMIWQLVRIDVAP
ncbi:molybdopterin-dependent oxidoreductase [Aestuariicoccus sp. MJ-SS9]|uniref:molybdopterin-dependent oxidoreductase n=1 Tax=Aestuariicoccus sp. MJ-SS9 TaxID=3079855 RepID=UPI002915BE3C|nr:oxidoreductase [Aestuariicoccus sp. MJ-SS9]MDU8913644.1 oxidoreductase [Aestuariicoccus sp. MJ-SS9]